MSSYVNPRPENKYQAIVYILIFVSLLILIHRVLLLSNSETVPARIISCGSKWVEVTDGRSTTRTKEQVQYYPVAEADNGTKVTGNVMMPTQKLCNQMVGKQVEVLLHNETNDKDSIYSFIQFWALPLLMIAMLMLIISSLVAPKIVRAVALIFTIIFVAAISKELGYWGNGNQSLTSDTGNQNLAVNSGQSKSSRKSQESLERCVWSAMHKQKVKHRQQLKTLVCQGEDITDLSSIADLENLEELYLQNNALKTLSGLKPFKHLRKISVAGNKRLTSTKGIESTTDLIEFQANKSGLKDLSGMEALTKLEIIGAMQNNISDLTPLSILSSLKDITLSYNKISKISALANKPLLEKVTLYDNPIKDISPMFGNNQLKLFGFSSKQFVLCEQVDKLKSQISKDAKVYAPKRCL